MIAMALIFSLTNMTDSPTGGLPHIEIGEIDGRVPVSDAEAPSRAKENNLLADKFRVPHLTDGHIPRPRLQRHLRSSLNSIGAVLITGRAGSGKTALAADIARSYASVVWYRVEAADSAWQNFSGYLSEGILNQNFESNVHSVSVFIEKILSVPENTGRDPRLIILDDIHNVFDAEWFKEFFSTILFALPPLTHLIFLARSEPSFPLWRLRSKQVLAVFDETLLMFDRAETEMLCSGHAHLIKEIPRLYSESFGRIGKLRALIASLSKNADSPG